jgi:peptidoglycan/xylan/chitin deacetylase (PgdA/CDA1 family)
MAGIAYLMYHELERTGRALCQSEPGYVRYVLPESEFHSQLASLRANCFHGLSVSEALRTDSDSLRVALTFDDGCETDLITAAPALAESGFHATFYIVSDFLGRRGYLSRLQLNELSSLGFEIGCHSRTHAYLPNLDAARLREEIGVAKAELEQILGRPVEHFSCPGGRWSPKAAQAAREMGFCSLATSRTAVNCLSTDPYRLARVALQRGISLPRFERLCRGNGLLAIQGRDASLQAAKALLGDSFYERVRSRILEAIAQPSVRRS